MKPVESLSQVFLTFGPSIGISVPVGDYAGETVDFYNGIKYGLKPGVNFGATGVIRTTVINLKGVLSYSLLQNSGNAQYNVGSVDVKQNVFTFAIGPQYSYSLPQKKVRMYAEALIAYSIFSGITKFTDAPHIQNGTYDMNSTSRFGAQFGIGTEVKLELFRLDFNLTYGILNFSKKFIPYDTGRENAYINLNDDGDPSYSSTDVSHPIRTYRMISLLKFNVSVVYDIDF
ncbi:MAG: hypothetical protein N2490_00675 [Ignavibacteria bacterium]|nr:hypothetical protein [Ignavibacteria bacterium]